MYRLPEASTATLFGELRDETVAAAPSSGVPKDPLPAIVVMRPSGVIFRTRLRFASAMYRPPALSNARPDGELRCASTASCPSPLYPAVLPAIVVIIPEGDTRRIRA